MNSSMGDLFAGAFGLGLVIFIIVFCLATIIAMVKLFQRANEPGIAAIIPFYNTFVLSKIVFGNGLFMLIPIIGAFIPIVGSIIAPFFTLATYFLLGKVYGKSTGFCVGLCLASPIFMIILAFDESAYYQGPVLK